MPWIAALALVAALLCISAPATAVSRTWIDGSGRWDVADNWSPAGQPQAGDDVLLLSVGPHYTVGYYDPTNPTLNSLEIDAFNAGTMALDLSGGDTLTVTTEYVGRVGQAAVIQSAGVHEATVLYLGSTVGSTWAGWGEMTIQSGAQASCVGAFLGNRLGSSGTVTVDGSGSGLAISSILHVGYYGSGQLKVQAGGQVSSTAASTWCLLGDQSGSTGTATVTGAGSTWTNGGDISIGEYGAGTLKIEDGGQVSNSWVAWIGNWSGSTGTVRVTGAGSTWTNYDDVYVGYLGTGALDIQAGGQVNTWGDYTYLGYLSGSTGTATVDGSGSVWNSSSLYVGGSDTAAGGTGTVTVSNGGRLTVPGLLRLWKHDSTHLGSLTIESGGIVTAGVLDTSSGGTFTWTDGTLEITGPDGLTIGATGPLGAAVTLGAGKNLSVTKTATIASGASVALSGGSLTAGTLANSGTLAWTSGTLGITGTGGLGIDPGGPLGAAVTLGTGQALNVTHALSVASGAALTVDGASLSAGTLANLGQVVLRGAEAPTFAGPIANGGSVEFDLAAGTWTFDKGLGGGGSFLKSGDGTLVVAGPQDYQPGALFDVGGGAVVFQTDAGAGGADLDVSVTGAEVRFASDQHLDTLAIGDGGKVVLEGAHVVVLNHLAMGGFDLGAMTLTPEPATLTLVALGGLGVLLRRRK
jgi:T5SS/PEP-CTERM-associated repeat protein